MTTAMVRNNVGVEPLPDPDKRGSLWIPDVAKQRCDQGIVKYVGPEVKDVKIGMHVLFSGYTGTLVEIEHELLIIMPEEFVTAIIDAPNFDIPGLYFRSLDGEYFQATYEFVMKLMAKAATETDWFEKIDAKYTRPNKEEITWR